MNITRVPAEKSVVGGRRKNRTASLAFFALAASAGEGYARTRKNSKEKAAKK